jgi:hypothetical protein
MANRRKIRKDLAEHTAYSRKGVGYAVLSPSLFVNSMGFNFICREWTRNEGKWPRMCVQIWQKNIFICIGMGESDRLFSLVKYPLFSIFHEFSATEKKTFYENEFYKFKESGENTETGKNSEILEKIVKTGKKS